MSKAIPVQTIQTVARSIYKEASGYGFGPVDIIRLINELMDLCNAASDSESRKVAPKAEALVGHQNQPLPFPLMGQHVLIREYCADTDLEFLESWLPDKYGRFFVLSCATAQTVTIETLTSSPGNHLGIITMHDGIPIGVMAYLDHSQSQRRAELRKLIGDVNRRGQGLAEEATRLWIAYGIQTLGLEKIFVSTLQTHISNIKLNEDIGFKVEGLLRNEILIDDQRHDVLRMGIWLE